MSVKVTLTVKGFDDLLTKEEKDKIAKGIVKGLTQDAVHRCDICGAHFSGHTHNADPVKEGICCEDCNTNIVIPLRRAKATAGALLLKVDGSATVVKPKGKHWRLEELQHFVGGLIEIAGTTDILTRQAIIIVNEEGLMRNLPKNQLWENLAQGHKRLVGNILITPAKYCR